MIRKKISRSQVQLILFLKIMSVKWRLCFSPSSLQVIRWQEDEHIVFTVSLSAHLDTKLVPILLCLVSLHCHPSSQRFLQGDCWTPDNWRTHDKKQMTQRHHLSLHRSHPIEEKQKSCQKYSLSDHRWTESRQLILGEFLTIFLTNTHLKLGERLLK